MSQFLKNSLSSYSAAAAEPGAGSKFTNVQGSIMLAGEAGEQCSTCFLARNHVK